MPGQCALGLLAFILHAPDFAFGLVECFPDRLDQAFDGFFLLVEVALGLYLELLHVFPGQLQELCSIVFECAAGQRIERVLQRPGRFPVGGFLVYGGLAFVVQCRQQVGVLVSQLVIFTAFDEIGSQCPDFQRDHNDKNQEGNLVDRHEA